MPPPTLTAIAMYLAQHAWHAPLGEIKRVSACGTVCQDVPCRVENEDDDSSDFSLFHRCLGEDIVVRHLIGSNGVTVTHTLETLSAQCSRPIAQSVLAHPLVPSTWRKHCEAR